MSFGMILCACRGDAVDHNALNAALALSKAHGALLRVIQTVPPWPFLPESLGLTGTCVSRMDEGNAAPDVSGLNRQRVQEAISTAAALAGRAGVTIQLESRETRCCDRDRAYLCFRVGTLDAFLSVESRCCDLVVIGYESGSDRCASSTAIALRRSYRPVLLIPRTPGQSYLSGGMADCVTIAWDDGMQCVRAVQGALPLLATAKRIRIVTVVESRRAPETQITTDFRRYLEGHRLEAEVSRVVRDGRGSGAALLDVCLQRPADLLVMGAVGQGPASETFPGEMTDYVLRNALQPLLLSQ